ncbi:MAG TPA: amino acid adenylation domain-containing protein, partial [Chthonomonadaceae bacterium]|nr:amino acid adenylation domain-containing protein [Chthonomonadaceae bacterium]
TALGAYAHQDLPFEKLVEELSPERSLSHSPLFQVVFTLQNEESAFAEIPGLELNALGGDRVSAKFDLQLAVANVGDVFQLVLEYNTDLFDADRMERLFGHYQTLLEGIVADPEEKISRLPLLTKAERSQLLTEWNSTEVAYPRQRCIHQLFEEQVERAPEAIAVEFEGASLTYRDRQLTYAQLNGRANALAHALRRQGVGPDVLVGLAMERSLEMAVALLGILKAGGAYLPLDPANPHERLQAILEDARPQRVLTDPAFADRMAGWPTQVFSLDEPTALPDMDDAPENRNTPNDLAYVMFTSGSTGTPKGVAVPHRAVVRLVQEANFCKMGPGEVFLQLAPLAFDASTLEIWGSLLNGARLVLFDGQTPSLEELGETIQREHVSTLWLTAGLFHTMVETNLSGLQGVRQLLAGGDVLSPAHVHQTLQALPDCQVINGYGPTENTTFTCCYRVPKDFPEGRSLPIGHPISNTQVYILDHTLAPVPIGVVGELYAGGDGLARGYANQAELTAQKFLPNPFGKEAGGRLYRTGDLARWRADGSVEFIGRGDGQVKIRGFRIELGEIESALREHESVAEVVVVTRQDASGDKRLAAYLVAGETGPMENMALRAFLKERLPEYMLPSAWVWLEALPLTPNGKVDRKALPTPDPELLGDAEAFVAPRTPTEEMLAGLWEDLLNVRSIGMHANFFELGGHSLLATRVMSRLRSLFAVDLPMRVLFERPTLAELAHAVETARQSQSGRELPSLLPVGGDQGLPLSFAQQRLWFLDQLEPGSTAYNISGALQLTGVLNVAALEGSLAEMVRRHETLRTVFAVSEGEPVQVVREFAPFALPLTDLSTLAPAERQEEAERLMSAEARRPFDLTEGPLFRSVLIRMSAEEHLILLTLHHIVSDGWSQGVLTRELAALYNAFATGQPSPLPDLPIQYADYAAWQRNWLQGEALERQIGYWKEHLSGVQALLELPTDRPRPAVQTYQGALQRATLSPELSSALKQLGQQEGSTLFMTLLAAFH